MLIYSIATIVVGVSEIVIALFWLRAETRARRSRFLPWAALTLFLQFLGVALYLVLRSHGRLLICPLGISSWLLVKTQSAVWQDNPLPLLARFVRVPRPPIRTEFLYVAAPLWGLLGLSLLISFLANLLTMRSGASLWL
jgi:Na+-driven multidrug efflux pump